MTEPSTVVRRGFYWEDLPLGRRFATSGRTITEADLAAFINLSWLTEELFANATARAEQAIAGRVVPAALVYSFAEGLLTPTIQHTGLAFLRAELDVKSPTLVGDTIHVECEVTERRPAAKGARGLVRTLNRVMKQDGSIALVYTPLRLVRRRDG
jgi:acyl dehydratase